MATPTCNLCGDEILARDARVQLRCNIHECRLDVLHADCCEKYKEKVVRKSKRDYMSGFRCPCDSSKLSCREQCKGVIVQSHVIVPKNPARRAKKAEAKPARPVAVAPKKAPARPPLDREEARLAIELAAYVEAEGALFGEAVYAAARNQRRDVLDVFREFLAFNTMGQAPECDDGFAVHVRLALPEAL